MAGKRWRQLAVWLHVVSGVGWMAQALALALVSLISFGLADPARQPAAMAMAMANRIDLTLLAQLANVSTFTGFMPVGAALIAGAIAFQA